MSIHKEDYSDQDCSKRRRVRRACDVCRRKKIRCDQMMADGKCTTCVAYNFECTYIGTAKKRGPPNGYLENLESRLEKLEKLIQRVPSSFMPMLMPTVRMSIVSQQSHLLQLQARFPAIYSSKIGDSLFKALCTPSGSRLDNVAVALSMQQTSSVCAAPNCWAEAEAVTAKPAYHPRLAGSHVPSRDILSCLSSLAQKI